MSEVIVLHAPLDGSFDAERAAFLLARLRYARRLELERRDAAARAASLRALDADGRRRAPARRNPRHVAVYLEEWVQRSLHLSQ